MDEEIDVVNVVETQSVASSHGDEDGEGGEEYEVEKILLMKQRGGKRQFKVRWLGFSSDHDTWEPEENLGGARDVLDAFLAKQEEEKVKSTPKGKGCVKNESGSGKTPLRKRVKSSSPEEEELDDKDSSESGDDDDFRPPSKKGNNIVRKSKNGSSSKSQSSSKFASKKKQGGKHSKASPSVHDTPSRKNQTPLAKAVESRMQMALHGWLGDSDDEEEEADKSGAEEKNGKKDAGAAGKKKKDSDGDDFELRIESESAKKSERTRELEEGERNNNKNAAEEKKLSLSSSSTEKRQKEKEISPKLNGREMARKRTTAKGTFTNGGDMCIDSPPPPVDPEAPANDDEKEEEEEEEGELKERDLPRSASNRRSSATDAASISSRGKGSRNSKRRSMSKEAKALSNGGPIVLEKKKRTAAKDSIVVNDYGDDGGEEDNDKKNSDVKIDCMFRDGNGKLQLMANAGSKTAVSVVINGSVERELVDFLKAKVKGLRIKKGAERD